MARIDGRANDEMRPVTVTPDYISHAEGSALIEFGKTRVLCVATIEDGVPPWLTGRGQGWITSEYAMLPRAGDATVAPRVGRGQDRRAHARDSAADWALAAGGGGLARARRTHHHPRLRRDSGGWWHPHRRDYRRVDCAATGDEAAQGTRHVAGGSDPSGCRGDQRWHRQGHALLDLAYDEDSNAEVDANIVMTSKGDFIEVQGTAEGKPFTRAQLDELLGLAEGGIRELLEIQQKYVEL